MFGDVELGDVRPVRSISVVIFVAINEHHDIRILYGTVEVGIYLHDA